jgi:hypothetical protein
VSPSHRKPDFGGGDGMDHTTALQAANQALGGRASRATNRFASVELRGVDELGRTAVNRATPTTKPAQVCRVVPGSSPGWCPSRW